MNLKTQKRLAADILGVGENRVWIDPDRITEVSTAITRADIRSLIKDDAIRSQPKKSTSKARVRKRRKQVQKGLRKGPGSRKGAKGARTPKKDVWKRRVRSLRRRLHELRDQEVIDSSLYRKLYRMVKGGSFRSKAHLESYLKKRGILEE